MVIPHEEIKRERLKRNISQVEMAEAAGMSRSAYINFEKNGSESLSLKSAVGIAEKLNIPFGELFKISGSTISNQEFELYIKELESKIEELKSQLKVKNDLTDVLKRENNNLWIDKAKKAINENCFLWLEDEKRLRNAKSTSEIETIKENQKFWMNDARKHVDKAFKENNLTLNDIFIELIYNTELMEIFEEDSNSTAEFISNLTTFIKQFFYPVSEKVIGRLLEKNKGFKKTLSFRDKQ